MARAWIGAALAVVWIAGGAGCGAGERPVAAPCPVCPGPAPDEAPPPVVEPPPAAAPDVRVEGALRLDGIPPADPDVAAALRPFLDARDAALADLSADGRRLLISTRFGATRQLHRVDAPGGDRRQLTFEREPVGQGRWVPGHPDAFLMIADVGGDERYQLWRVDGATRTRLTDGASRNVSPVWSVDGARLAWASTARNGTDLDIWISDGVTPSSARIAYEVRGSWAPIAFAPGGGALLLQEYVAHTRSYLHRLDLATGEVTRLSPDGDVATPTARWGPRDVIYAISDREAPGAPTRRPRLWSIARDGTWTALTGGLEHDVETLEVARDGTVVFTVNVDGASELRVLEPGAKGRHRAAPGVPADGVIGGLRAARDADVVALTLTRATSPGDVHVYDLRRRRLTRWTESELAGLDPAALAPPALVRVTSFDGLEVPAWVYRPAGAAPSGTRRPVIVDFHGGPEGQWRPRFQPFQQFLVARGYVVVQPNVRGSTGYGREFAMKDDVMKREDAVADAGAILDWIATQPDLDPERVAVMGGSYGGYMALAALIHHGARLRAGIDVVGISSFVTFLERTSPYRRDLRRAEYGDERDPEVRAFLERISPLTRAAELRTPLLVAQGANDPRVPASEAEQIVAAARGQGADVWYLLAANEGHGFARQENREAYFVTATMFLDRHLR